MVIKIFTEFEDKQLINHLSFIENFRKNTLNNMTEIK